MYRFRAFIGGGLFLLTGMIILGLIASMRGGTISISAQACIMAFLVGGLMGVLCRSIILAMRPRTSD